MLALRPFSSWVSVVTTKSVMRTIGWVNSSRRKTGDEDTTLASLRFQPGDFLDVALMS